MSVQTESVHASEETHCPAETIPRLNWSLTMHDLAALLFAAGSESSHILDYAVWFLFWGAFIVVTFVVLPWILRKIIRTVGQQQEALDLTRQTLDAQQETNRLLSEIRDSLKQR